MNPPLSSVHVTSAHLLILLFINTVFQVWFITFSSLFQKLSITFSSLLPSVCSASTILIVNPYLQIFQVFITFNKLLHTFKELTELNFSSVTCNFCQNFQSFKPFFLPFSYKKKKKKVRMRIF